MKKRVFVFALCLALLLSTAAGIAGADSGTETQAEQAGSSDVLSSGSGFSDVNPGDWFYDEVQSAVAMGLMNGVGDGKFDPQGGTTCGMVLTMLARLDGDDNSADEDAWYASALAWAEENGIADGMVQESDATREQVAVMLYRYVQVLGGGFTEAMDFALSYTDSADVSEDAEDAMYWCTVNGVLKGFEDGTLRHGSGVTRAQTAAMFVRFSNALETEALSGTGSTDTGSTDTGSTDTTGSAYPDKVDMTKWLYEEEADVYYQTGISYCTLPADTDYETMGIFVPGGYFDATDNGDGTYTCSINTTNRVGAYTSATAPMTIPVETPGYSAMTPPSGYTDVSDYTD